MAAGKKQYPLSIVVAAVDRATRPLERVTKTLERMSLPLAIIKQRFAKFGNVLGLPRLVSGFRGVFDAVGSVASAVGGLTLRLGGLAAAATAAGFVFLRSFARAGDDIAKTARLLGIGVEALQEYRYAGEIAGVAQATMDRALKTLGVRVGEVAKGTGEGKVAFEALGVSVRDAAGNVRTLEDLLPELADKLSAVSSENERNAIAARLFSIRGVELNKLLTLGSAEVGRLTQEFRGLGAVIGEKAANDSEAFNDAWLRVKLALSGVRNVIASAVLPQVTELFARMQGWLVSLQPRVQEFAARFLDRLPEHLEALRGGMSRLWQSIEPVLARVRAATERLGGLGVAARLVKGAGLALVAFLGAPLLTALATAGSAVLGLGAAFLATPFGWITAGLAAVVGGAWWLWDNWGQVGDKLSALWERLKSIWESTVGAIGDSIRWVVRQVSDVAEVFAPSTAPPGGDGAGGGVTAAAVLADRGVARSEAHVTIDMQGVPRGVDVRTDRASTADLDLNVGLALPGY